MYTFAKKIKLVIKYLPLPVVYCLGAMIGFFLFCNIKKRIIAYKNVKSAFPEKTNSEVTSIVRKSFIYFGQSIVESFIPERLTRRVTIKGTEHLTADGGIFAAIHEGSWELYNCTVAQKVPYSIFAKEQKIESLDRFLNEIRRDMGLGVCTTLKEAIKLLKKQTYLGFVVDHGAQADALLIDFFGHLVPTPRGAVHLARKFNKKIFPCFGYRDSKNMHTIVITKPIVVENMNDMEALTLLCKIFERFLTQHPYEYLWHFKRFKNKKNLNTVIISDGKPGHVKQSQALVFLLQDMGFRVRSQTIEIAYKNKFYRLLAEVCALLSNRHWIGRGKCLWLLLGRNSYRELESMHADVVISTGSIAAPINRIFAYSVGAKSITILRPNTALRKFDLSIIPEHDRIQADRCVNIKGALFYPADVQQKVTACKSFFKLNDGKYITFFLGGSLVDEQLFMENLKLFITKLKNFSLANKYKILISTSRRTPESAVRYLEDTLDGFENIQAIVYANRQNYDFVFDGFTSLSKIVFVSSESISMISEILSFKKPCVCVFFEKHMDKHRVFFQSIANDVSELQPPYDVEVITPRISNIFESNKKIVQTALSGLL